MTGIINVHVEDYKGNTLIAMDAYTKLLKLSISNLRGHRNITWPVPYTLHYLVSTGMHSNTETLWVTPCVKEIETLFVPPC